MSGLKEIGIAIARIVLGLIVLIEGIIGLVFIDYTSRIGGIYSDKIAAAYEDSYDNGYAQTYDVGCQEAYGEAYDKGYDKGYEIGLETGSKEGVAKMVELSNPTYKEMKEFLARDKTDSNAYIRGEYVCSDFASDVNNNAELEGIRTAYVRIRTEGRSHAIVAFQTVDRGLLFVEPMSDREAALVIGKPFPWYWVGAASPLGYHDPLVKIQIIW